MNPEISRSDIPVLVIFGPTASGKTSLASALFASDLPQFPRGRVEIISADSMQVYRGMDIGTAKPDPSLLKKLPHHLIDICDPRDQFCAGDFVRLADAACADIFSRGKLPVVLGGTAFYIRNFLYGLPDTPQSDPELRESLRERMSREGAAVLYRELVAADAESAVRIHPNDEYRIIRALEVCLSSGRKRSSFDVPRGYRSGYRFFVISLDRNRDELYGRIDLRVREMIAAGLPDEFLSLCRAGYTAQDPGMQAIGYREFFAGYGKTEGLEEIVRQIQHDSRKYAKRQETFFRSMSDVFHVDADDFKGIYSAVCAFYSGVPTY